MTVRLTLDEMRAVMHAQVIRHESKANKSTWSSCVFCWMVAGKYGQGDVLGLADELGKSDDTVYDRAHAYDIFVELCKYKDGKFRQFVFSARRAPFITWSHFRALYDAKKAYNLTTRQVMDLLRDVVNAEGGISSRAIDGHTRGRYGVEKGWEFYAGRVSSAIEKALPDPDLPKDIMADMKKLYGKLKKPSC